MSVNTLICQVAFFFKDLFLSYVYECLIAHLNVYYVSGGRALDLQELEFHMILRAMGAGNITEVCLQEQPELSTPSPGPGLLFLRIVYHYGI